MNTRHTTQPQRPARPKHEATRSYNTEPGRRSERRSRTPTSPVSAPTTSPLQQGGYNISMTDQNVLTRQFTEATGAMDMALASDILAGKNWNLKEAVSAYKDTFQADQDVTDSAAAPPVSPAATPPTTNVWHTRGSVPLTSPLRSPVGAGPPAVPSSVGTGPPAVPSSAHSANPSTYSSNAPPVRKLLRGLSKVYFDRDNEVGITSEKDNVLNAASLTRNSSAASKHINTNISLDNSYMIPDLTSLQADFMQYVEHELIDFVTMNVLERTGHINWWAQHSLSRRLWPLYTTGDGNCLLHAASLAMWGIQDRFCQLRNWLHMFLQKQTPSGSLYRRWRWQQTQSNMEMGLILSEEEWQSEWDELMSLSSMSKKVIDEEDEEPDYSYEFLEEFHVYVLAQIINRPILVFADAVLRDVNGYPMSPIPFGGIYLPLECKPEDCYSTPLMLAYDRCHFTAVVTTAPSKSKKENNPMRDLVPLTGPECDLLPMHFFVDPGKDVDWDNLPEDKCTMRDVITSVESFLDVKNIPLDQIQADVGSLSKSGSSNSVNNNKDSEKSKPKTRIKFPGSKSTKIKEEKEQKEATGMELEPGNELIMCAKLATNPLKSYQKDMERYISMTREEYEQKKAKGTLPNLKDLPPIATKDYALLHVKTNRASLNKSPSAISPADPGANNTCRHCEQYLGTPEQDDLCSSCYRLTETGRREEASAELCKKCHSFKGTKEQHDYCSRCYNEYILLDNGEGEQANNSNAEAGAPDPRITEYVINMPQDGENYNEHERRFTQVNSIGETQANQNHHYAFPTAHGGLHGGNHEYQVPSHGNRDLQHAYDRDPAGYLQRVPVTVLRSAGANEPFHYNYASHGGAGSESLSLGMDGAYHTQGLHRVSENRRQPSQARYYNNSANSQRRGQAYPAYTQQQQRYTSRHDENYGREVSIPIHRQDSTGQRPRSRGSISGGGTKGCRSRNCNRLTPVDDQGFCRFCRNQPQQQPQQQQQYKTVVSQYLATCKRHGCSRPASNNLGLCSTCGAGENRQSRNKYTNDKYNVYG